MKKKRQNMKKKSNAVKSIAKEVRDKCLRYAMSHASHSRDYHMSKDLTAMCAVASTALAKTLRKRIDPHAVVVEGRFKGDEHCWVLSRGKIIDITASQFPMFRNRKVVIAAKTSRLWEANNVGAPGKIATNWPSTQAPTSGVIQKILSEL
jgi:hypothetical protein